MYTVRELIVVRESDFRVYAHEISKTPDPTLLS